MPIRVSKIDYEITDDIIRVITIDDKDQHKIIVKYQENTNLKLLAEKLIEEIPNLKDVIVITEDGVAGRVYRYDRALDSWYMVGTINGM